MDSDNNLNTDIVSTSDDDTLQVQSHSILNKLVTNIVYDLVHKVYRNEKIARANTIASNIEAQAALLSSTTQSQSGSSHSPQTPLVIDTPQARWEDGEVYLKGNPMDTITEACCPTCKLPVILDPIDGVGAIPLDPTDIITQYCTRHPYISKPGHDIYGNPFPTEDYKISRKAIKLKSTSNPGSQLDSSAEQPTTDSVGDKTKFYFPSTACTKCKRQIGIRDFRKHLTACMGISSRASGRAAAVKASSSFQNTNSSPTASPAPASRKSTPKINSSSFNERLVLSQKEKEKRSSPAKRLREYTSSPSPDLSSAYEDDEQPFDEAPPPPPSTIKKNKLLAEITDFLPLPNKPRLPVIKISHKSNERKSSLDTSTHATVPSSKEQKPNGHGHNGHNGSNGVTTNKVTTALPKKVVSQGGFNGMMGQVGTVKKWKSGNVTLDGKRIDKDRDSDRRRE